MSHAAALEDRVPPRALAAGSSAAWRPAFLGDWAEATFVHFAVEPRWLQPSVPFELELYQGQAYVSLVAFTMRHMRPAWLDTRAGELLLRPIMPCRFLNVRTYVRAGDRDGIYFLGEWLSQWVNIPFGPLLYGLPYHAGRLQLERDEQARAVKVDVRGVRDGRLTFRGQADAQAALGVAAPGSLEAFLLERYFAFTVRRGQSLVFRVEHEPWPKIAADISMDETSLLRANGDWISHAHLAGGHLTPGAFGVAMGAPQALRGATARSAFMG
jgi:uncharacterized protein YqjF (DUF2071 family)